MSCYMTGYMDTSFLSLVAVGLTPKKPKKNSKALGGD